MRGCSVPPSQPTLTGGPAVSEQNASSKSSKPNLESDVDALKDDLGRIRDDLRKLSESLLKTGKGKAEHARDQVKSQFDDGIDQVEDFIEKQPLLVVVIAFAIGLIAGKLFSR